VSSTNAFIEISAWGFTFDFDIIDYAFTNVLARGSATYFGIITIPSSKLW
jgi:hypothetical protein